MGFLSPARNVTTAIWSLEMGATDFVRWKLVSAGIKAWTKEKNAMMATS
jgi:hypothetical protein